ncbi:transcriptional regulator [Alphaproteobacteria bacterium]|nr:transcriptional regulator [Alphaproteobacteria bacterium]
MNKQELVDRASKAAKTSKADAARVIDAVFATVTEALKKGDKVSVVGFGSWFITARKATEGRNPRTGAKIKIPASKQPKFKAGKGLKDAVNAVKGAAVKKK